MSSQLLCSPSCHSKQNRYIQIVTLSPNGNNHNFNAVEYICYDDACHLKRYARNTVRRDLTKQTKQLASVEMAVDKMQMKGHIDPWCKANCDPAIYPVLNKVHY